ncbi:hypothetical protein IMSAG049_01276 [Clostridiales bacterium]|nr:hypothetical protein IMSAG049_01276 [Clostridiales bacterium]
MEMLTKNIVMSACGGSENGPNAVQPAVGEYLNNELLNAIGLARAYVPVQPFSQTLNQADSLACGSAFGALVSPYVKGSALARNNGEECSNE